MSSMVGIAVFLDPYLIPLYRMTGYAFIDYFVGTFLLAMLAVVVGEFTLSLALRFNARHFRTMEKEMEKGHEMSMAAYEMKDQKSYQAINKQANEVFGKYFFNMIACSAGCLWPLPFALAWMQSRFQNVEFHFVHPVSLVWSSTGYFTTFILSYILARIVFKQLRPRLPYFRTVHRRWISGAGQEA